VDWRDRSIVRGSTNVDAKSLERVPLFAGLSPKEREKVARWADTVDLPAGKHLLEEGRLPHEFFVILDGEVEVLHEGTHLATLGPGDFFGEIALVDDRPRTATVVAESPLRALVVTDRAFRTLLDRSPEIESKVMSARAARLAPDDDL
jgi:CRP/FNR family transcriptional regulator, cyclic AMP receptor protein